MCRPPALASPPAVAGTRLWRTARACGQLPPSTRQREDTPPVDRHPPRDVAASCLRPRWFSCGRSAAPGAGRCTRKLRVQEGLPRGRRTVQPMGGYHVTITGGARARCARYRPRGCHRPSSPRRPHQGWRRRSGRRRAWARREARRAGGAGHPHHHPHARAPPPAPPRLSSAVLSAPPLTAVAATPHATPLPSPRWVRTGGRPCPPAQLWLCQHGRGLRSNGKSETF